ncbi:hypothetical protein [Lacrimispora indolis]|uniref:hypothetical protein n=1 Tax=Lacrimispora indolis TaxID=69825 RepID=UPI00045EC014|nr:hypothetical protein [Lacrimispora indolis]
MNKVITFTEEQVLQIQYMLNAVTVTGIQNAKQIAAIAQMLELGTPGEIKEPEKKENHYSSDDWENPPEQKTSVSDTPSKRPVHSKWEKLSDIDARVNEEEKKEGEG